MCGLTTFINFPELTEGRLGQIASNLNHRGPDEQAWKQLDEATLLHTRLSILDLKHSHQPLSFQNRYHVSYNGEIYNYKSIRKQLIQKGVQFQTEGDTEVIPALHAQEGIACLKSFNGMFAFGLWDSERKEFFAAVDRMGVKPLYYWHQGERLACSSEIHVLASLREIAPTLTIDETALGLYFLFGYIPPPWSIYKEIKKLEPGHYFHFKKGCLTLENYWKPPAVKTTPMLSDSEAEEALQGVLKKAVHRHMLSDVPLGALVSGGIDSSVMLAIMQAQSSKPIQVFSAGFQESDFNEAGHAQKIASYLGSEFHSIEIGPSHFEIIFKLIQNYGEPFGDSSAVPTYWVSHLARSKVKVVLGGDGADELYAGYARHVRTEDNWKRWGLRQVLPFLPEFFPKYQGFKSYSLEPLAYYLTHASGRLLEGLDISSWLEKYERSNFEGASLGHYQQLLDIHNYLPGDVLKKVDGASMAVSLETRVPFMDRDLVEFSLKLPEKFRYRQGQRKWLLKKVLARYLPKELWDRPKQGFAVPIGKWFRKDLKPHLTDYLSLGMLQNHAQGILDPKLIEKLLKEHMSVQKDHSAFLWYAMMFSLWAEYRSRIELI